MNTSLRTLSIENSQDSQYFLSDSVRLNTATDWIQYLSKSATSIKDLSSSQLMRFHLASYINDIKHQSNRHLIHLTLTYKPFADYSYSPKNTNDFFIYFYTKYFLPFLLNTKNIQRSKYRELQPICLAFLDEHESRVSSQTYLQTSKQFHHINKQNLILFCLIVTDLQHLLNSLIFIQPKAMNFYLLKNYFH